MHSSGSHVCNAMQEYNDKEDKMADVKLKIAFSAPRIGNLIVPLK